MHDDPHRPLRDDVRPLGRILGDTIRRQTGDDLFEHVERVRGLAKGFRAGADEGFTELIAGSPVLRRSIDVRNPYVDPINLVQVELLRRLRAGDGDEDRLREALLVTVNGVAAGMRNTG